MRNHNISKDYTMQELDRITTLNSIKEHVPKKSTRKEQTDQDKKRSVSVKVKNDLGRKSTKSRPKELRNKSSTATTRALHLNEAHFQPRRP